MKISVIGAGGFVGARVAARLAADPAVRALTLVDRMPLPAPDSHARVETIAGDITDPDLRRAATQGADAVILLAAILGGAAEADYALARRVNIDATLAMAEELKDRAPATRFVFASTIAVFGKPMPDPVTDLTPTAPGMVYGAQKLMIEVALSQFARRGWLDAVSLRPAGVMARDGADAGLKSAFLSRLFWCIARGEDITLPVAPDSRTWLTSVDRVAANFIHAAQLPELGETRAFTLPALAVTMGELATALKRRFPDSPAQVRFAPDPEVVALFGSYPRLVTETADALGFQGDRDIAALIDDAMI